MSIALHAAFVVVCAVVLGRTPALMTTRQPIVERLNWIAAEGASGKAARPSGRGSKTVAAAAPARGTPAQSVDRNPLPAPQHQPVSPTIPALPTTTELRDLPGAVSAVTLTAVSSREGGDGRAPGGIPGGGRGGQGLNGDGDGPGGGESGSGPGTGTTEPVLMHQVSPVYTSDAVHARAQGLVEVEAVVNPDGSVGAVRIVRALNPPFGLDLEAVRAVKQWRFRPGQRLGRAVPVFVIIELTFGLR